MIVSVNVPPLAWTRSVSVVESANVNVSVPSRSASSVTGTETVAVRVPAGIVTERLWTPPRSEAAPPPVVPVSVTVTVDGAPSASESARRIAYDPAPSATVAWASANDTWTRSRSSLNETNACWSPSAVAPRTSTTLMTTCRPPPPPVETSGAEPVVWPGWTNTVSGAV